MVVKHEEISLAKMYEDVDLDRSSVLCKALRQKNIWSVTTKFF